MKIMPMVNTHIMRKLRKIVDVPPLIMEISDKKNFFNIKYHTKNEIRRKIYK